MANERPARFLWPSLILAGSVLAIVLIFLRHVNQPERTADRGSLDTSTQSGRARIPVAGPALHFGRRSGGLGTVPTADEIVAAKLVQFGRNRRDLVHTLAKRFNVDVPDDVERFFDAVERGNWEEIDAAHRALLLSPDQLNQPRDAELHRIWRPIQEAWGAAREVHNWPAQKLLDYGDELLGSLRPGMVYVGGTDPGAFITSFLNETSDGEHHVVLTQNALADGTYIDYLNALYGDRMTTLSQDDCQSAFNNYVADAQKRFEHDQQFPDEPKQVRPGEDLKLVDGKFQVSGQVAVMAINEKLLQMLLQKNPEQSFAMEESFSLPSTYPNATPLGPIMDLRGSDPQTPLTADVAMQSISYWRDTAQQLLANPETPDGSYPRHAYSHMAEAQANLFAAHDLNDQAEQAYRIATTLQPDSSGILGNLAGLLAREGRTTEANQLLDNFARSYPKQQAFVDTIRGNIRLATAKPAP
jgi:hypothetical protein